MSERLIYWDSCLFLDLFDSSPARAGRHEIASAYMDEANARRIRIMTSVLTIAEVVHGKVAQNKADVDDATLAKIDKLWMPPSPIRLVDVDQVTAEEARAIARAAKAGGISQLRSADVLHLATARRIRAHEFHTHDEYEDKKHRSQRQAVSDLIGIRIGPPAPISLGLRRPDGT